MYGLVFHIRFFIFLIFLFFAFSKSSVGQIESKNGWVLPASGTIRVLMVFVEIDYDVDGSSDPYSKGSDQWKVNELPSYKDEIFNSHLDEDSLNLVTRYYQESSFGQLNVLGDYYPEIITLKQSDIGMDKTKLLRSVFNRISASPIISSENLNYADFDFWENGSKRGAKKISSTEYSGVDHVMIFLRNFAPIPNGNGQASGSSGGKLGGFNTDSYSIFGGGSNLPFKILKHEFNHLLLGGNNFHSGGGNSINFRSYVHAVQGGWSMMGAGNSSLMSPSGWDRHRLGWKPDEKKYKISALDRNRQEINGDILPQKESETYILRDFVTTGDAIRIKLPFIPEEEYPQWIWLENHTTTSHNGSPTDKFVYEDHDCMMSAQPGLFLMRQIDANQREGSKVYSGIYADYLKPIPATGAYDYIWDDEKLDLGSCVNNEPAFVYNLLPEFENPLTGHHEMEEPFFYTNESKKIDRSDTRAPGIRRNADGTYYRHPKSGDPLYAMMEGHLEFIGIGTNPVTASTLTHVSAGRGKSNDPRNSDAIYLNGLSIKILETLPDLSLKIRVAFTDSMLRESRRWAGSDIILNNHNPKGSDLYVKALLKLDRGKTLTRFIDPDTIGGETFFSSPTVLRIEKGAKLTVEKEIVLLKDSKIVVEDGGELEILRKGKIILKNESVLIFENGATFSGKGKIKFKDSSKGLIENSSILKKVKRRTCQNSRLEIKQGEAKL